METIALNTGVGSTAIWVAGARALESERPEGERLCFDPLAKLFIKDAQSELVTTLNDKKQYIVLLAMRTKLIDDFLLQAVNERGCRQVVVLGSGMDTRAFRMNFDENCSFYEVDLPDTHKFKNSILEKENLKPKTQRTVVSSDLSSLQWVTDLLNYGFKKEVPTAWVLEGISMYLTEEENNQMLSKISQLSPVGSRLCIQTLSTLSPTSEEHKKMMEEIAKAGVTMKFACTSPDTWISKFGFTPDQKPVNEVDLAEKFNCKDRLPESMQFNSLFVLGTLTNKDLKPQTSTE